MICAHAYITAFLILCVFKNEEDNAKLSDSRAVKNSIHFESQCERWRTGFDRAYIYQTSLDYSLHKNTAMRLKTSLTENLSCSCSILFYFNQDSQLHRLCNCLHITCSLRMYCSCNLKHIFTFQVYLIHFMCATTVRTVTPSTVLECILHCNRI